MDVYVLLNLWNESATVAGAATSLADAELIADRHGQSYRWADWWTDPSGVRRRRALWADGSPHYGFMQQIAQIPLAGGTEWNGTTDPIADLAAFSGEQIARIGYPR